MLLATAPSMIVMSSYPCLVKQFSVPVLSLSRGRFVQSERLPPFPPSDGDSPSPPAVNFVGGIIIFTKNCAKGRRHHQRALYRGKIHAICYVCTMVEKFLRTYEHTKMAAVTAKQKERSRNDCGRQVRGSAAVSTPRNCQVPRGTIALR